MIERITEFSDDEKSQIAEAARVVARMGEDVLWEVTSAKIQLMALTIGGGANGLLINGVYYTPGELRHEVEVMEEITSQAKIILQFEGRDTMSELDRRSQEAGWGSVYDPNSKIYKSMNNDGRF